MRVVLNLLWLLFAGIALMFSWTIMNSGIEATSKLAPSSNSVRTMSGSGFAFTA